MDLAEFAMALLRSISSSVRGCFALGLQGRQFHGYCNHDHSVCHSLEPFSVLDIMITNGGRGGNGGNQDIKDKSSTRPHGEYNLPTKRSSFMPSAPMMEQEILGK